jgi:hypothetical protein
LEGEGIFTGNISGTLEESSIFSCGYEYSKSYLGYEANVGIFPAKFSIKKQIDPGITQTRNDAYTYNSIFLEAEGIMFPYENPLDKISPFIKVGLGGMKTTGDINNNLLSISGSAGARIFISDKFGVDVSQKIRYMLLCNVLLTNEISAAYGAPISSLIA